MRTNDEIIDLLTLIKEEKNLSISEIARQVGMAKSAVSRYFNKTRKFPLNRADKFAKVFGISPEYLLGVGVVNDITRIYNQLTSDRQDIVFKVAEDQLEEQNKIVQLHKNYENSTDVDLAAHLVDPSRKFTEEEIDGLKSYLSKAKEDYLNKNK